MNNQGKYLSAGRQEKEKRILPFVVEFVKFSAAFSILIAFALVTLHVALAQ